MRTVDTKEYLDNVRDMLSRGHTAIPVPVAGNSMCPFLHHGDTVFLDLPRRQLKKGDIVLFTRPSGRYVLHRISRVKEDGSFLLLGDNQMQPEPVAANAVHALVTTAIRKGKPVSPGSLIWWFYAHVWLWLTPQRRRIARLLKKR